MAPFNKRPSRPIVIGMMAAAVVLVIFGIVTFIQAGLSWFAVVWLVAAAALLVILGRRLIGGR